MQSTKCGKAKLAVCCWPTKSHRMNPSDAPNQAWQQLTESYRWLRRKRVQMAKDER
jgi:hypothetical protein